MIGKETCRILKEIRQRIADENEIPYVTRECHFQGECKGTCPRCESELRYLEQQLSLRASLGKRVAVAALCAGMTLSAAGCAPFGIDGGSGDETQLSGNMVYQEPTPTEDPAIFVTTGEVAFPEDGEGDPVPEESAEPVEEVLMGDMSYLPDEAGDD